MIIIIIGRVVQFVLALIMLRCATTLLSPEEVGRVSLLLTTIAFFSMFLINPVGMFINRRLHAWQAAKTARTYLKLYPAYLAGVSLIAIIILLVINSSELVNFGLTICWLALLICASLVFNTINQTSIPLLNLLGYQNSFVSLSVATLFASFVCAAALVVIFQASAQFWLLGIFLGQTLLAVIGTKVLFTRLHVYNASPLPTYLQKKHLFRLFGFAWPVALAAGFGWAQNQGYRFVLESHLGLAELGLFAAGYSISAGIIAGFESILTTYFQPRLYRDVSKDNPAEQEQAWQRYASSVIPSLLLTVVLIMMLAEEFTLLFLGEQFQEAVKFVAWGALAEAARTLTGVYSLIAHIYMRTSWLILPTAVGAVLSILLCLLLIPSLGAEGAGIALALAGFLVVALLHILMVRRTGCGVPLLALGQSGLLAVVLGIAVLGLRTLFGTGDWLVGFSIIAVTGLIYLGLLYSLLRQQIYKLEIK